MELMFLVYAVENLTYDGSFFMSVAGWILVLTLLVMVVKGGVNVYNQLQKPFTKTLATADTDVRVGDVIVLEEGVCGLEAGKGYKVNKIWGSLNQVRFEGKGMNDFDLSKIKDQLRKQSYREEVVQPSKINLPKFPIKTLVTLIVVSLCLHTLLPSRQTAIYMASAYAIQQVVTADKTKELADKGYNALSSQLDKWSKEVPEVADMLVDAGLATVKDKVAESK